MSRRVVEGSYARYRGPGVCWLVLMCWSVMPIEPSATAAFVASIPFAVVLCWRLLVDAWLERP